MKSDLELEWQRRRFRVRSCRQDFTDKVGEPQRDRQAVGKGGAAEIQLRQRHQIRKDGFYRAIAARDVRGQRSGNLACEPDSNLDPAQRFPRQINQRLERVTLRRSASDPRADIHAPCRSATRVSTWRDTLGARFASGSPSEPSRRVALCPLRQAYFKRDSYVGETNMATTYLPCVTATDHEA